MNKYTNYTNKLLFLFLGVGFYCFAQSKEHHDERKLNYLFTEAVRLKNIDKLDEAFELFRYCYSIDSTSAPVLFELSGFYMVTNQPSVAVSLLETAVRVEANNKWYLMGLADAYIAIQEYTKAINILEQIDYSIHKKEENSLELTETLLRLYSNVGDWEKGILMLNRLEEAIGIIEQISMNKFQFYMMMQQPLKAMHEIDKLVAHFEEDVHYAILKGDILMSLGQREEAEELYKQVAEKEPNNPELLVSIINKKMEEQLPYQEELQKAIKHDEMPYTTKQRIMEHFLLEVTQNRESSIDCPNTTAVADTMLNYLIERNPTEVDVKILLAKLQSMTEHKEQTVATWESVIDLEPDNEEAWNYILKHYVETKAFDKLIILLEKTIIAMPEKGTFYYFLGIAYVQVKAYDKALEIYQKGIEMANQDGKSAFLVSEFYGQIGDLLQNDKRTQQEIAAAYEKALKLNPNNISALNNYAYYLSCQNKELAKAERMIAKCMELEPGNTTYLDTYAWVFFQRGDYALALIYIERAIEGLDKDNGEVREHYGDILFLNDKKEEALNEWTKALKEEGHSTLLEQKIATQEYIPPSYDN